MEGTSVIQVQILGVQGRTVGAGKTIYDISCSNGQKYTTFDAELAGKAQALSGQQVQATVTEKQNGKWTNYYLDDVVASAGAPQAVIVAPVISQGIPIAHDEIVGDAKQKVIVRQNVLGTAFAFASAIYDGAGPEAWAEAEEKALALAGTLYAKVLATPQPATVQSVAAEINAAVGADAVVVGADPTKTQSTEIPW